MSSIKPKNEKSNLTWSLEVMELPLKFDWKISRNTSSEKKNLLVTVKDSSGTKAQGEVAFNVRYKESLETIKSGFEKFVSEQPQPKTVQELHQYMKSLGLDKSLRFGIESAWVHFQAKKLGQSVSEYLGLPAQLKPVKTSFSLPILDPKEIGPFIHEYDLTRFKVLKIKVDSQAEQRVREVAKHYNGPLRIDANEAWKTADEVLQFAEKVKDLRVEFIEQPLPDHLHDELLKLKQKSPFKLVADESITDEGVSEFHRDRFHGVNIKLMKSGGYYPALEQLQKARELGLETMLGCMVETSLGISSAINISDQIDYLDLDGSLLLKKDPMQLIEEKDGFLYLVSEK